MTTLALQIWICCWVLVFLLLLVLGNAFGSRYDTRCRPTLVLSLLYHALFCVILIVLLFGDGQFSLLPRLLSNDEVPHIQHTSSEGNLSNIKVIWKKGSGFYHDYCQFFFWNWALRLANKGDFSKPFQLYRWAFREIQLQHSPCGP